METIHQRFERLGLFLPDILLPAKNIDLEKWAVIACDQFTQDRDYWEQVKKTAGGEPSVLELIYPEVFLADGNPARRIAAIHGAMKRYLAGGIFAAAKRGGVYIERNTPFNKRRRGLVLAVDLEHYDWNPKARRLIRCTEGTVAERLPPRMDTRRGAPLETTHVLLLIDDEKDNLFTTLAQRAQGKPPAYRSALMRDAGDISGWFLDSQSDWEFIAASLEELSARAKTRYPSDNSNSGSPFLFAVGDGNHSLAAAKEIWEEYKKNNCAGENSPPNHPCRYALVEIENIYDPAIQFEPIHRILFNVPLNDVLSLLSELPGFSSREVSRNDELIRLVKEPAAKTRFGLIAANQGGKGQQCALIETDTAGIATASLQPLLDRLPESGTRRADANAKPPAIDYIHGEDELFRLATAPAAVGILLPPVEKSGLFETVARGGPLPRKSFSMGEACEKRFYIECRKLFD